MLLNQCCCVYSAFAGLGIKEAFSCPRKGIDVSAGVFGASDTYRLVEFNLLESAVSFAQSKQNAGTHSKCNYTHNRCVNTGSA